MTVWSQLIGAQDAGVHETTNSADGRGDSGSDSLPFSRTTGTVPPASIHMGGLTPRVEERAKSEIG
jgi:hypothetical protein